MASNGPRLVGSRCTGCEALYFPRPMSCRNPHCTDKRLERELLSNSGTLFSYTVQRYRPPPLFQMDDWAPYAIGIVDLGEGVQVMAMLTGMPLDAIEIDMPLKLVVDSLFTDPVRGSVLTYKFAPDDSRRGVR